MLEAAGGDREIAIAVWGTRGSEPLSGDELDELVDEAGRCLDTDVADAEVIDDGVQAEVEAAMLGQTPAAHALLTDPAWNTTEVAA